MRIIKVNQQLPSGTNIIVNPQKPLEYDAALRQLCQRHQFFYNSAYDPGKDSLRVSVSRFADSEATVTLFFDNGKNDALMYRELRKIISGELTSELWPPIIHVHRSIKKAPGLTSVIPSGISFKDAPVAFWTRYAAVEFNTTDDIESSTRWKHSGNDAVRTEHGWIGHGKDGKELVRVKDGSPNPLVHEAEAIIYNGASGDIKSVLLGVSETLRKEVAELEARGEGAKNVTKTPVSPARAELDQAIANRHTTISGLNVAMSKAGTTTTAAATMPASIDLPLRSLSNRGGLSQALTSLNKSSVKLKTTAKEQPATVEKKPLTKKPAAKKAVAKPLASLPAKKTTVKTPATKPASQKVAVKTPIKKAAVKKAPAKKAK